MRAIKYFPLFFLILLLAAVGCCEPETVQPMATNIKASPANSFYFDVEATIPETDQSDNAFPVCYKHELGGKFGFQLLSTNLPASTNFELRRNGVTLGVAQAAVNSGSVTIDGTTYTAWSCSGTLSAGTFTGLSSGDTVTWFFDDGTETTESAAFIVDDLPTNKYVKVEYFADNNEVAYGVLYTTGFTQTLYVPVQKWSLVNLNEDYETLIDQSTGQAAFQFGSLFDQYELVTGEMKPSLFRRVGYAFKHPIIQIDNLSVVTIAVLQARPKREDSALLTGATRFQQSSNPYNLYTVC